MSKIFEVLGLLSWLLCFSYEILFTLKNYNSKDFFKDFKNKALQVIRLDKLFLIIIFIIYLRFNKDFITSLVFTVICLYMYINKLYEKSKKEKLMETLKKHWLTLLIVVIIASLPFIYFILTKNIDNTYITLLFYIFFSYFIVGISKKVINIISSKKH